MDSYFDSAIIVKLYVSEATSPAAIFLVAACIPPYCLTHWQALEVRNAIRLKAFRKEMTALVYCRFRAGYCHRPLATSCLLCCRH
jgi:predicted nucleic acid-binding protein